MLRRIVKDNAIDVVHGHHRFASLVSRLAVRGTDAVCVASVHDLASGNRAITRFALGPSIMVYSDAVGAHLRNHFGIASERIASIPMGMTSNRDVPPESITALKSDLRCPPSAAVVLFAGRLDWEKAPDLFVNAAAEIADAKPEVRFWIVGDGEMRSALEARVRELDIADRVTFTGWRDDIDVVLEAADVLVAPSRREGFGRSVLEAMSHGKSVVATKTGGLAELIDDGRNGLFARDDASSLADAVIRVLNDRALSVALGRGALETAKRYGREAMIRETERTYHRARGEAS